jgi:hypothetical protein
MYALGHKRTFSGVCVMSALPPKADIMQRNRDVRFVPKAANRSNSPLLQELANFPRRAQPTITRLISIR